MVAGSTKDCVAGPIFGVVTATVGIASSSVHFVTSLSWVRRFRIPPAATPIATSAARSPIRPKPLGGRDGGLASSPTGLEASCKTVLLVRRLLPAGPRACRLAQDHAAYGAH